MLDAYVNQGASLHGMAQPTAWSIAAMVTQGDTDTELPLLWQICAALCKLNYRITVLDATSTETEANPGLQNLLDQAHWLEGAPPSPQPWQIVPARRGLQRLATESQHPEHTMQPIGHLFRHCDLVVLYADAPLLAVLLPDSNLRPLLTVTSRKASILSAYINLKKLQQQARLVPFIATMAPSAQKSTETLAHTTGKALQRCAKVHLGCQTEFMTVRSFPQHNARWADAQPVAQRLVASAIPMAHPFAFTRHSQSHPVHGVGSH
jgi:hypothetical protein